MGVKILTSIDERHKKIYQQFLLNQPDTLFYQSLCYHELLKEHLNCESVYFTWWNDEKLIASLPFLYKGDKKNGTVFNSLPYYGSNGGFVFENGLNENEKNSIRKDCLNGLKDFAGSKNGSAFTIISNPLNTDEQNWMDNHWEYDFTDYRIGQITKLPGDSEDLDETLMKNFSEPRPRNIRRAIKSGITVEAKHDLDALLFLYDVHKQNIEGIGGKAKKKEFFELIPKYFKAGEYDIYLAYKEGNPIAGLLLFYFNKTIEYFTPATVQEFRNDQPSALIIFEAMKRGIIKGFRFWNWGGTWNTQHGVYDFKKRWGASDNIYKYYTRVVDKSLLNRSKEELLKAFPDFYIFPFN